MAGGPAGQRSLEREGGDGSPVGGLRIEPVSRRRLEAALSLLASGRADLPAEIAARHVDMGAVSASRPGGMWMAWRGDRPVAAAGVVPGAGATAMVFVSPPRHGGAVGGAGGSADGGAVGGADGCADASEDTAALVRAACAAAGAGGGVRLLQALVRRDDAALRGVLERAGFDFLAELTYMQRRTARQGAELSLPDGLSAQTWGAALRGDFAAAISASYEQTLDCPGLVGLRRIDDVLDGHLAVGALHEDLWLLIRERGEPAGVMLVSLVDERRAAELVYLGLRPSLRGRGLGRLLLEHGLRRARRAGAEKMLLAVDERNVPALRLYQSLRFVPIARRTALVKAAGS
jgi:mycothiol synthase